MAEDDFENIQRWTARRRTALVLQLIRGETSAQEAARKQGSTVAEVENGRPRSPTALRKD